MKDTYLHAKRLEEEFRRQEERRKEFKRIADENPFRTPLTDREKLKAFAHSIRNLPLPVLSEKHAQEVFDTFIDRLGAELDQFERAIAGA